MAKTYDHTEIEAKWAQRWFEANLYKADDFSKKEKKFIMVEFPYPSGDGLHCGHLFRFTLPDVYARKLRMQGYNVLFPIGWDAFGLPAENYAVKTGVHPAITTEKLIENYKRQMLMMGYGFDWDREISTTYPEYYKWTQWIFLRLWERGLAELSEQPVWWCEALRTVLANEEVLDDGKGGKVSERGLHPVEKRMLKQWVLKMPRYAEKLLEGLEHVEFPESVRLAQQNWIGRSEGAELIFPLSVDGKELKVFTTRPDTILGATFLVIAPEHPLIDELRSHIRNWDEVSAYRAVAANRSDLDRKAAKDKSGVRIDGVTGTNPLSKALGAIPIFIADYVLMDYGTGSIMAVPAHDDRDFEFAKKFDLPIIETLQPREGDKNVKLPFNSEDALLSLTSEVRELLGDDFISKSGGKVTSQQMKEFVVSTLANNGKGEKKVTYKMRDWLFSRQRYWGEPVPLVHCEDGSIEPIVRTDDKEGVKAKLPLLLPSVADYLPSSDGHSPLANNTEWVNTKDSKGRPAKRETNTMPNWAGSCWYYLRYTDPKNDECFADPKKLNYWLPVDKYFGGSEHTTLHLLYSRFWHEFLYDEKLVPTPEPYAWRMNGGILLGSDMRKMSKSWGNTIIPDDKVKNSGADALRIYVNFMGPYDGTLPWAEGGLRACRKLVERIIELSDKVGSTESDESLKRAYHRMVKRITYMVDNIKTNTAISELMIFVREAEEASSIDREIWGGFLRTLAPFAVFAAEELWQKLNGYTAWKPEQSVHLQSWPTWSDEYATDDVVTIGVQINGKVRDQVEVQLEEEEASVKAKVLQLPGVQKWTSGKELKQFVYKKGRIVNLVVN